MKSPREQLEKLNKSMLMDPGLSTVLVTERQKCVQDLTLKMFRQSDQKDVPLSLLCMNTGHDCSNEAA